MSAATCYGDGGTSSVRRRSVSDWPSYGAAASFADRTAAALRPATSSAYRPTCCLRHRVSMAPAARLQRPRRARGWREAMAVRLAQREREGVGRLAAVAHEVRNPLGGMSAALIPCASSATIRTSGAKASSDQARFVEHTKRGGFRAGLPPDAAGRSQATPETWTTCASGGRNQLGGSLVPAQ
jgi:hypothetical protein